MRARKLSSVLSFLAAALVWAGSPSDVEAQGAADPGNLALSRMLPAPAGDRMFGVQSPYVAGNFVLHGMLLVDYAHNPLVVYSTAKDTTVGSIVGDQLFMHAGLTLAMFDRMQLSVDMPFALFQTGDNPTELGSSFPAPGTAIGDLSIGARLAILGNYDSAIQVGVGGYVWLPTGAAGQFGSDQSVRGLPQLLVGGRTSRVVWSFAAGPELRKSQTIAGVEQGTMIELGARDGLERGIGGGERA